MPKVSSVIVPYASYLRVYEPLAAFPEPERGHWARYARRPERPSYQDELRRSLADLLPTPPIPVPVHESGDAFVAERRRGALRVPLAHPAARLAGPGRAGRGAAGAGPGRGAARRSYAVRPPRTTSAGWSRNPDARPWIRTSTWQVPLNWFVLVSDEERRVREGGGRPTEPRRCCATGRRWCRRGGGWRGP